MSVSGHSTYPRIFCRPKAFLLVFSSPEPKARVSYCHSAPSVVRPSVVRPSSVRRKLSHFRLLLCPKSVRNSCVIKVFGGVFMLSRCLLDCSVAVGVFVTGLSQISSFFSSETTERNSTKLDRKQDLNALYQVCVFRADRKNRMAGRSEKQDGHPGL